MKKVTILAGLPGSGKSTWCTEHPEYIKVSKDDIREQFGLVEPGKKGIGSPEQEAVVRNTQLQAVLSLIGEGKSVVIDDTNILSGTRKFWINKIRQTDPEYRVNLVVVYTPPEICIGRRDGQIPSEIIWKFWNNGDWGFTQEELNSYDEFILL